jgi:hypothetical protein
MDTLLPSKSAVLAPAANLLANHHISLQVPLCTRPSPTHMQQLSEPVCHTTVSRAMQITATQFVHSSCRRCHSARGSHLRACSSSGAGLLLPHEPLTERQAAAAAAAVCGRLHVKDHPPAADNRCAAAACCCCQRLQKFTDSSGDACCKLAVDSRQGSQRHQFAVCAV